LWIFCKKINKINLQFEYFFYNINVITKQQVSIKRLQDTTFSWNFSMKISTYDYWNMVDNILKLLTQFTYIVFCGVTLTHLIFKSTFRWYKNFFCKTNCWKSFFNQITIGQGVDYFIKLRWGFNKKKYNI